MNKMKRLIKHIIFRPFYKIKDGKYIANEQVRRFLNKMLYLFHVGKPLRLTHPKDLNEKIIWLKLYSDTSRWSELADKYAVRGYIEECGLSEILNDLYAVYNNPNDIDLTKLPQHFVLKLNNGSGTVMVVNDKYRINECEVKETFKKWMEIPFGLCSDELHYLQITPMIIAEKYLNENNSISHSPIDYKFYCIDGKAFYVMVCYDRIAGCHAEKVIYDIEWNFRKDCMRESIADPCIPKPNNFGEMIAVAERLSKPFPFVRVDLYNINGQIIFGEMTFTPMAGWSKVMTQEVLDELGDKIVLPN
jgi:hypothetical protein